jgi:hypothetical protein
MSGNPTWAKASRPVFRPMLESPHFWLAITLHI